jgi:hypothetical protein
MRMSISLQNNDKNNKNHHDKGRRSHCTRCVPACARVSLSLSPHDNDNDNDNDDENDNDNNALGVYSIGFTHLRALGSYER